MAKRPTTRKPRVQPESNAIVAASITIAQTVNQFSTRARPDTELIARAVGSMYNAADTNATVCVGQPLRLFRPAVKGAKTSIWPGRKVTGARKAFHMGRGDIRPTHKAVALANMADDFEEVLDHPALDLLARPDPRITGDDWMWLVWFWQEMTGRAYLHKGERANGAPTSLYALAPQFTVPVGSKTTYISHYRYGRDTTDAVNIPPEDMIYLRSRVHPSDPLGAISWPQSVILPGDMEGAALQSEVARWVNGGQPGGVIEVDPKTSPEQYKQVQDFIRGHYTGVNKSGAWMVLRNAKVTQYAAKPHEMAYKDGLLVAQEAIYRAAGIPESMWKKNDANLASSLTGDRQYMGQTIWPRLCSMASALTEFLLVEFLGTEGYWFAFDNPVKEDRAALVLEMGTLADKGIVTGNEARAALGIEPAGEELDIHRWMGQPIVMPAPPNPPAKEPPDAQGALPPDANAGGEGTPPDGDGGGDAGGDGKPDSVAGEADDPADDAAQPAGDAKKDAGRGVPELTDPIPFIACECRCGREVDVKDDRATGLSSAIDRFAADLHGWYARVASAPITENGLDLRESELQAIIDRGLREVFVRAAIDAIPDAGGLGGTAIDAAADRYVREHGAALMRGVTDTLREQVRTTIADGLANGKPMSEIQGDLGGLGANRAETVLRTEVSAASNDAARLVYAEAGWQGKRNELGGSPCGLCEAVALKFADPIPIGQPFLRAGESIVGTDGKVYVADREYQGGPFHPNCVCGTSFVESMEANT